MVELLLITALPRPTGDFVIFDDYHLWSPEYEPIHCEETYLSRFGPRYLVYFSRMF